MNKPALALSAWTIAVFMAATAFGQSNTTATTTSNTSGLVVSKFDTNLGLLQGVSSTFTSNAGTSSSNYGSGFSVNFVPGFRSYAVIPTTPHSHQFNVSLGSMMGNSLGSVTHTTSSAAPSVSPSFGILPTFYTSPITINFSVGSHSHSVNSVSSTTSFNSASQLSSIATSSHSASGATTSTSFSGNQQYTVYGYYSGGSDSVTRISTATHTYSPTYSTNSTYTYIPKTATLVNSATLYHSGEVGGINVTGPSSATVNLNTFGLQVNGQIASSGSTGNLLITGGTGSSLTAANGTFNIGSGSTTTVNTSLNGNIGLTKLGAGTLALTGSTNNTYLGTANVNAGTLVLGKSGGATAVTGNLVLNGGNVSVNGNNQIASPSNVIVNSGTMSMNGYAATVRTLKLGGPGQLNLGSGSLTANLNLENAGTITGTTGVLYTGGDLVNSGTLAMSGGGRVSSDGTFYNSGQFQLNSSAANATFRAVSNSGTMSLSGVTSSSGSWNNTGTITVRGDGFVNAGDIVNNNLLVVNDGGYVSARSGIMGSGHLVNNGFIDADIFLSSGGVLSGSGNIDGMLSVTGGSMLAPGNSVGLMSGTDAIWGPGGIFEFEINDADGSMGGINGWDGLALSGFLDITATVDNPFLIDIYSLDASNNSGLATNFNPNQGYSWTFLTASGGISGFASNLFLLNWNGFHNPINGSFQVQQTDANSLSIVYNVAETPEPTSLAIFATGTLLGGFYLRRKRRQATRNA